MPDSDVDPESLAKSLTEEALILRLNSTEHDFVERKSRSAKRDWLQTAVAFANSAPIGWPGCLIVGVDDQGKPQVNKSGLEDLEKSVSGTLDQAYPAIYRHVVPLHLSAGSCLAVIIPGSDMRPHFAGKSYVRIGPEIREASEEQFETLIAERISKPRELLKWRGREITFRQVRIWNGKTRDRLNESMLRVVGCNAFYVTLMNCENSVECSCSLSHVEVGFDHEKKRLLLEYAL